MAENTANRIHYHLASLNLNSEWKTSTFSLPEDVSEDVATVTTAGKISKLFENDKILLVILIYRNLVKGKTKYKPLAICYEVLDSQDSQGLDGLLIAPFETNKNWKNLESEYLDNMLGFIMGNLHLDIPDIREFRIPSRRGNLSMFKKFC